MERKYYPHLIVTCQNMRVYHLQGTLIELMNIM